MKKIILLLSAVLTTSLLLEMTIEIIKDAIISKAKSQVIKAVAKQVSDNNDIVKDASKKSEVLLKTLITHHR